jgi:hypothetical protein
MEEKKIHYSVQLEEEIFLKEFGAYWTDEQFDVLTSGFKGSILKDPSVLPDPNSVDPRTDPIVARNSLLNPKSTFSIAEQPFVLPLLSYLTAAQQQVPSEIQVLKEQYNLYLIKYSIDANPQEKEQFTRVELHLDYPTGHLTFSMIPDTTVEETMNARSKTKVALDPHLKFAIPDVILKPGVSVGGGIEVATDTTFLLSWEYRPLRAKVIALGAKSSYAQWIIEQPKQMIGSIELVTVLCVPKGVREMPIEVKGSYRLARGIWWWQRETIVAVKTDVPILVPLP